jgi:hypothetical protein
MSVKIDPPEYVYGLDCVARVGVQADEEISPAITLYVASNVLDNSHVHVYLTTDSAKDLRRQLTRAIRALEQIERES